MDPAILTNILKTFNNPGSISMEELHADLPELSPEELQQGVYELRSKGLVYNYRDDLYSLTVAGQNVVNSGGSVPGISSKNITSDILSTRSGFFQEVLQNIFPHLIENHPEYSQVIEFLSQKNIITSFLQPLYSFLLEKGEVFAYPGEDVFHYENRLESSIEDYVALWLERLRQHGSKVPGLPPGLLSKFTTKESLAQIQNLLVSYESEITKFVLDLLGNMPAKPGMVMDPSTENVFVQRTFNQITDITQGFSENSVKLALLPVIRKIALGELVFSMSTPANVVVNELRKVSEGGVLMSEIFPEFSGSSRPDAKRIFSETLSNRSDLSGSDFRNTSFTGLAIIHSDLSGCDFDHVNSFTQTVIVNCNLTNAKITNTDLTKISGFSGNNLTGTDFLNTIVPLTLIKDNTGTPKNLVSAQAEFNPADLKKAWSAPPVFSHSFAITPSDRNDARTVAKALQGVLQNMTRISSLLRYSDEYSELRNWIDTGMVPPVISQYILMGPEGLKPMIAWLGKARGSGVLQQKGFSKDEINWLFNNARALFTEEEKPKTKAPTEEEIHQQKVDEFISSHQNQKITVADLVNLISNKEGLLYSWISGLKDPLNTPELWSIYNSLLSGLQNYHMNSFAPAVKDFTPFPYVSRIQNLNEVRVHGMYAGKDKQFAITLDPVPSMMPAPVYKALRASMGQSGGSTTGPHLYGEGICHGIVAPIKYTVVDAKTKKVKSLNVWQVGEWQSDAYQKSSDIEKDIKKEGGNLQQFRRYFRDWPLNMMNALIEKAGRLGVNQIWVPKMTDIGGWYPKETGNGISSRDWSRYYDDAAKAFGGELKKVGASIKANPHGPNAKETDEYYVIDLDKAKKQKTSGLKLSWAERLDENFEEYKRNYHISSLKFSDLQDYDLGQLEAQIKHHFEWVIEHNANEPGYADVIPFVTNDMIAQFAYRTFFDEYRIPQSDRENPEFMGKVKDIVPSLGYKLFDPPYIDWLFWMNRALNDVQWFVKNQREISPDLGASKEELARDWFKLWVAEAVPEDIKSASWYSSLFVPTVQEILEAKGFGDILGTGYILPESPEERTNLIINPVDTGEGGKDFVNPEGEVIESKEEDETSLGLGKIFEPSDIEEYKQQLTDQYLEALHEAIQEGDQLKIQNLKHRIQELQSLSSLRKAALKLSWNETSDHKISPDGTEAWYKNNAFNRLDGPAVIKSDGTRYWYINGNLIGNSRSGFTDKDFEKYKQEHRIRASKM